MNSVKNKFFTHEICVCDPNSDALKSSAEMEIRMKNGNRDEKKINIVLGCILLVGLTSLPLFTDFLLSGRFLAYQLLRIESLKAGLSQFGISLWAKPDWLNPQGFSFAFFYGDSFLYIPAFLRLIGLDVQMSYRLFLILINAVTVIFSYVSFRELFQDAYTGLLGTTLYSASVYRLFLMYAEGELGEVLALAFLPLALLGGCRILLGGEKQEKKTDFCFLGLGLSGVFRSHILGFGIAVLFLLVLLLIQIPKWKTAGLWKQLGLSALAFLLLNGNYLYGILQYIKSGEFVLNPVSGQMIQKNGLQAAQLFMCFYQAGGSHEFGSGGVNEAAPVGLGFVLFLAILAFFYLVFVYGESLDREDKANGWKAFGIGAAACFMSLLCFPWDALLKLSGLTSSLVSMIQFPWHFLFAALPAFSLLGCLTYRMVQKKFPGWGRLYGIGLVGAGCMGSSYMLANMLFTYDFVRLKTGEELWFPTAKEGEEAMQALASGIKVSPAPGIWYVLTVLCLLAFAGCIWYLWKNRKSETTEPME